MTAPGSDRKVLFVAEAVTLAHVVRPVTLARSLHEQGWDVTLATELAREIGVPMRLANLTYAEMTEALNRGWNRRDSRSFLILQQERAGLDIKVPVEEIEAVLKRDG